MLWFDDAESNSAFLIAHLSAPMVVSKKLASLRAKEQVI
jgi:hypothetical protein